MYEVFGFQIILLAEQGCVDGHRVNSPEASRCSREKVKKKKSTKHPTASLSILSSNICFAHQEMAQGTGTGLAKCKVMRPRGQLSDQSESVRISPG